MKTRIIVALALALVLMAPSVLASKQYHYTHTTTKGQTVLGKVGIFVGGVKVVDLNGDTFGSKDIYEMTSDSDCNTKHNTRDYEEAFSGVVTGVNPQGTVPLTWIYNSLTFLGKNNEHVSFSGGSISGTVYVNFERSQFTGTTALEAVTVIVAAAKAPGVIVYDSELLRTMERDVAKASTAIQANEIEADFHASGPGTHRTIDDLDWTCP